MSLIVTFKIIHHAREPRREPPPNYPFHQFPASPSISATMPDWLVPKPSPLELLNFLLHTRATWFQLLGAL